MIEVMQGIPGFVLRRRFGWPRVLPVSLTITPSPRCNSRCGTCRIWMKRDDEMSLEEWDRVFESLGGSAFWITISGGEPFLYRDLVPLCRSLYRRCHPGIINIPTNSLLCQRIAGQVDEICRSCPDSDVIVNLSLDGVGGKHDRIRGVPGNFEKFEENYRELRALKQPNLTIGIHSVISSLNVSDADELFEYALALHPDSYITEIAEQRVELDTVGMGITPSADQYSEAIDLLLNRLRGRQFNGISVITEAFRTEYYGLVKRVLREGRQVIPCFAGISSAQIYSNGDVWPCCVRADKMGNLREVGYDFGRVWFSKEGDAIRSSIRNGECHCPLANASYTNMLAHAPTLARVAFRVARQLVGSVAGHPLRAGRAPAPRTAEPCDGPNATSGNPASAR